MAEIRIRLPEPHPTQRKILNMASRFNAVCMGEGAGKTTLGIEVLIASKRGAMSGKDPVAWFSASKNDLDEVRRVVKKAIDSAIKRQVNSRRIELVNGNAIDFYSLDEMPNAFPQYGLIVVDDVRKVERFLDMFEDTLSETLREKNGEGWFLSGAYGKRNDFYRMWRQGRDDPNWSCWQFSSTCNPHLPIETRQAMEECSEDERSQRFDAEFLDSAIELTSDQRIIGEKETFLQWCLRLQADGLKVDGHPFRLDNRPSLQEIYGQIPLTIEEAFGRTIVLQKGAQMGLTVYEQLADLYMAIKFAPCKVLMYLPDRGMASYKSSERFMPIVRSIPSIHNLIGAEGKANDGNKLTRVMPSLGSNFLFLWTSGKEGGVSESFPGDILSLDETQGMTLEQIDRVSERLSASRIKLRLFLSTPLWPEMDINAWYLLGDQRKFHTDCGCDDGVILTDKFLTAALTGSGKIPIVYNSGQYPEAPIDYVYVCPECNQYIADPQKGRWVAHNPSAKIVSYHMSQILSPTVTARELIEAWGRADTADRRQNFFCRKLGSPYSDPSQVPVNLEMLRQCVEEGARLGVKWKKAARNTVLGVDQMGSFSCAMVGERLENGKMAIIHVEAIYSLDPWARLDVIMEEFGVQVAVVEQLPNIDSARQFSKRHPGKVFLVTGYTDMEDMVAWGDTPLNRKDFKTDEEFRDQFTVRGDQYRILSWGFARIAEKFVVFPNPQDMISEIRENGVSKQGPVLKEMVFYHFTKTGLIIETDDEQRKTKRKVIKIGIDPHFSFAFMALCMGWFRAHGTSTFILPDASPANYGRSLTPQDIAVPDPLVAMIEEARAKQLTGDVCGRCTNRDPSTGICAENGARTREADPGCWAFIGPG